MGGDVVTKITVYNKRNQNNMNYRIPVPMWIVYG